jgi:protein-disulfide isomerase
MIQEAPEAEREEEGNEKPASKLAYVLVVALILAGVVVYVGKRKVAERPGISDQSSLSQSETQKLQKQIPNLRVSSLPANELKGPAAGLGNPNAPLVIVEFSDFQCPYCARFHLNTFPQLKEKYIDTGKVYFVYRHFPLGFHQQAQKAAEAAECAREQGENKFWEMHDAIFQALLSGGAEAISQDSLSRKAGELGLNKEHFDKCLQEGRYAKRIREDKAAAARVGVTGTPTFVVGDKIFSGAYPFSAFKRVVEQELKAKER